MQTVFHHVLPLAAPGVFTSAVLIFIFAWNEFFLAVQLNPVEGSTVPVWVSTNVTTRGMFMAKLSAASTLAILRVVLAGWMDPPLAFLLEGGGS